MAQEPQPATHHPTRFYTRRSSDDSGRIPPNTTRKQRKEIRKLSDELIKSNHSEEVLKHKITIHNEMGQMILSSRQLLENNSDIESYKKSADEWIILSEKLSQNLSGCTSVVMFAAIIISQCGDLLKNRGKK